MILLDIFGVFREDGGNYSNDKFWRVCTCELSIPYHITTSSVWRVLRGARWKRRRRRRRGQTHYYYYRRGIHIYYFWWCLVLLRWFANSNSKLQSTALLTVFPSTRFSNTHIHIQCSLTTTWSHRTKARNVLCTF